MFINFSKMVKSDTIALENGELICKECGSKDIYVKAGMFVDIGVCKQCGNRSFI